MVCAMSDALSMLCPCYAISVYAVYAVYADVPSDDGACDKLSVCRAGRDSVSGDTEVVGRGSAANI